MAAGTGKGMVHVVKVSNYSTLMETRIGAEGEAVTCLCFGPGTNDGGAGGGDQTVVAGTSTGRLVLLSVQSRDVVGEVRLECAPTAIAPVSGEDGVFIVGGSDGSVRRISTADLGGGAQAVASWRASTFCFGLFLFFCRMWIV